MTDATPQFLDPRLGTALPRGRGMSSGTPPVQATASLVAYWTIGVSFRAIRQPFGDGVGAPLHYEYDLCSVNLVAIDCHGDPSAPDDRTVVQIAQDNPPQVGRVFTTWFGFDWLHSTAAVSAAFNRNLATKTANAYLGQQVRGGVERPCLAASLLTANGGTSFVAITTITLIAPGSATVPGFDSPLVAEDGSAPAPHPLTVPCWVGRYGFRGAAGQVLSGTAGQSLGYFLKLKPQTLPFTENATALTVAFTAQTADFGCEASAAFVYTMALLDAPVSYFDMDTSRPAPPYPCQVHDQECWKSREQTAYVQVFCVPLGDTWQVVLSISQVLMTRSASAGRYVLYSNFFPSSYTEIGGWQQTKPAEDVSATAIAFGTTTTVTRPLFTGEASVVVTISVGPTGKVTQCDARIVRAVAVGNLGPGWHDVFHKL
ncbi:MAG: hypothetical protein H0X38_02250 [Planctomycetes bacterium]|nr:hypothetical protein [Planctomycetota bacterium]